MLNYAGNTAILPGTSFLIVSPASIEPIDIRLHGTVVNQQLKIPLYPGYNFVSTVYTLPQNGPEDDLYNLNHIGLQESGFRPSSNGTNADLVLSFDPTSGKFGQSFYLDVNDNQFHPTSQNSNNESVLTTAPGSGFVILNRGDTYLWGRHSQ